MAIEKQTSPGLPSASPGPIPAPALWLSAAGLVPFVGLAGAMLLGPTDVRGPAELVLSAYAVAILAFMGGVHWGLTMRAPETGGTGAWWRRYGVSVLPPLVGWAAVFLSPPVRFTVLAVAFGLLLLYDLSAVRQGDAPGWYRTLRWPLTIGVVAFLVLAAIAGR